MKNDYVTFSSQMESIIQWNRGYNIENLLRKIYAKYVYSGGQNTDEIEYFYNNAIELVNNASNESELLELESILSSLMAEGKLDGKEYNYLLDLINDKRKEI